MPLTNAILLTFSAPLWMPLIAWALFREKTTTATWIGAAVGFVGVVLVLEPRTPTFQHRHPVRAGRCASYVARAHLRPLAGSERYGGRFFGS